MESNFKPCTVPSKEIHEAFKTRFSTPNLKTRVTYPSKLTDEERERVNNNFCTKVQPDTVLDAMRSIRIDTATGPDRVFMRTVKCSKVSKIIALIGSRMLEHGWVPPCFLNARTVLIPKNGDESDINNWRPISICSIIRRILERVLDQQLRKYLEFNVNQRGFTSGPGTHINVSIVDSILKKSKSENGNVTLIFLDISKAFDNVGHDHIYETIKASGMPSKLQNLIIKLQQGNCTVVESNTGDKTQSIEINRGVLQGAPLSPSIYNLCTDHILEELSEPSIATQYGYRLVDELDYLSVLGFADDTVIIGKSKEAAIELALMAKQRLNEIGLELNVKKSCAIVIENGKLANKSLVIDQDNEIRSIDKNENIRYLGVNFSQSIVFNHSKVINNLRDKIEKLCKSPLLIANQKMNILNQYIWPSLVYPLQNAPLKNLPASFLEDIDKVVRSAVKDIIGLPGDTPDSMIYTSRKFKGLAVFKAKWEAFLQHFNICETLERNNNPYVMATRDPGKEKEDCLRLLDIDISSGPLASVRRLRGQHLREVLRRREYERWCKLHQKGAGAILFQEHTPANRWIYGHGLSCSEWRDAIKLTANVAPVRVIPGRSMDGIRCRHCSEIETLPHVLGFCPKGELLRNSRHHKIRSLIAEALKPKFEVYEEVCCLAANGSTRRIDIIAIDRQKKRGYIIDPTVRFETHENQAKQVDQEKKDIYEPTIDYFKYKYNLEEVTVTGLVIGARGTIHDFFYKFCCSFKFKKTLICDIGLSALRDSIRILRNHLYN